jgi:electron transport complex protein RnfE
MAKKMTPMNIFKNGVFTQNPTFVLILGMCPTLGVTQSVSNAIGMGLAVVFVLTLSNMMISSVRKIVPSDIRIPVYISLIALLVSVVEWFMNAYLPSLYESLGIYLPLIVVNCIILGRAESFAQENTIFNSMFDGLGMGLGFTLGIGTLSFVREVIGTGQLKLFSLPAVQVFDSVKAFNLLIQPAGAFLTLGVIIGVIKTVQIKREKQKEAELQAKIAAAKAKKAAKEKAKAEALATQNQKEAIA